MTRVRVFIVFVLAITAGGVFAFGTYNYVQKIPSNTSKEIPTTPVVVAASDLDVGAEIQKDDIRVVAWPQNAVPANVIRDPQEVIGRGIIVPMIQNEPFLPMKLSSKDGGGGLPPAIPPGLRAVSVKVNEVIGVAGYVLPGTRVDVVATLSPTQQPTDTTSKVILTNVAVLASGTKIERDTEKNKPIAVTVVTLLVDPIEAEKLTLAANEGKIQLALRNPLDKTTPVTRGVKPAVLLGAASTTPRPVTVGTVAKHQTPPPPPPADPTVEIIRGDKRAHEVVRQESQ
jgi:pilus assembly protein CpaB